MALAIGLLIALGSWAVYVATATDHFYNHFVWQAAAFLEGHAAIRYPVLGVGGAPGNEYFQDVLPIVTTDGVPRGLLPFPPLPALVLLPFVALWGLATDDQAIFIILAATDVAICWWVLGRLAVRPTIRLGTTLFFAFGTVFWYGAQLSTTWYQAHIVAVGLTFLAIGTALGVDPRPVSDKIEPIASRARWRRVGGRLAIDPRQFVAGFLFGLACTARLTVIFGAPFFAFVGGDRDWRRRTWSAGLGSALPILALIAYNLVTTGHVFHRRTTTSTSWKAPATPASAITRIGRWRTFATCRRTSVSRCSGCPTSSHQPCQTVSPSIRKPSVRRPRRSVACSISPARSPSRATRG